MHDYQYACRTIDASGLDRVAPDLKRSLKYAIQTISSPAQGRPLALGASRLGGVPDLPSGLEWPTWQQAPMAFLAQLNLAELAPYDPAHLLPPEGMLSFFCQSQGFGWEEAVDYKATHTGVEEREPGSWQVLFVDGNLTALQPRAAPAGLSPVAQLAPCALQFQLEWTLPPIESLLIESLQLSRPPAATPLQRLFKRRQDNSEYQRYLDLCHLFDEEYPGARPYHRHRVLGYPWQIQGDEQFLCHLASKNVSWDAWGQMTAAEQATIKADALAWLHLLQIKSDYYAQVSWINSGSLSYWITQADLQARNFAGCWAITDSF